MPAVARVSTLPVRGCPRRRFAAFAVHDRALSTRPHPFTRPRTSLFRPEPTLPPPRVVTPIVSALPGARPRAGMPSPSPRHRPRKVVGAPLRELPPSAKTTQLVTRHLSVASQAAPRGPSPSGTPKCPPSRSGGARPWAVRWFYLSRRSTSTPTKNRSRSSQPASRSPR
jgi:hypothetical protein